MNETKGGSKAGGARRGDWRGELQALLDRNNEIHGARGKMVSHRTRQARADGLFRCFTLVRALGYKIGPSGLGGRHVQALVRYWTADPRVAAPAGMQAPRALAAPLSAAYIQQQLSFLRVLGGWIGKPGLVEPAQAYVDDPALVMRTYAAEYDHSWPQASVDPEVLLAQVRARCAYVGLQLELMQAFGLRRKEAVMFRPGEAEVPGWALPANAQAHQRYLAFLTVKRGTKGGRLRYTALRDERQRQVLERALVMAPAGSDHCGKPGLTLKQALKRFSYITGSVGLTRAGLGVTPHGLRHGFAADLYFDLTALPAPVRGGVSETDPGVRRAAYLEVARQLGHNRPQISSAYLGAPPSAPGAASEIGPGVSGDPGPAP